MNKSAKKPHEYIVSFEIVTKLISLNELSENIGLVASSGSRNKGEKRVLDKIEKQTWFRLFSALPYYTKLENHLDSIIKRVEKSKVFKKGILPKDSRLSICIAETCNFNKRAYFQINVPEKYVTWCGQNNVSLFIVAYPSN